MDRGTGETTRQMPAAPQGAIFIWCNGHKDYAERLARKHGREDLKIVSPSWLSGDRWKGMTFSRIIIDHAAELTERERAVIAGSLLKTWRI